MKFRKEQQQPEAPMSLAAIQARIGEQREQLKQAEATLAEAQSSVDPEQIETLLATGILPTSNRAKLDAALAQIKELESGLDVLRKAEGVQLARERKSQAEQERERIKQARVDYLSAFRDLTNAYRATITAQQRVRSIFSSVPEGTFPSVLVAELPTAALAEDHIEALEYRLVEFGFNDAVSSDSPARARIEHQLKHEAGALERARQQWIARNFAAGSCDKAGNLIGEAISREEADRQTIAALAREKTLTIKARIQIGAE